MAVICTVYIYRTLLEFHNFLQKRRGSAAPYSASSVSPLVSEEKQGHRSRTGMRTDRGSDIVDQDPPVQMREPLLHQPGDFPRILHAG